MRSRLDAGLLFTTALAAGAFLGARAPGEFVRASLLSGFQLEEVATRGTRELSTAEIVASSGLRRGTPLDQVEPARIEERLRRHPWIRRAHVMPLPPRRVLVDVVERRAAGVVELGEPPRPWLIDEEGQRFVEASRAHADRVVRIQPPAPGAEAEPAVLREGLRIAELVETRGLPPVEAIWLGGGGAAEGITLRLRGEAALIVLGAEPFASKLDRLERLRAAQLAEARAATTIDLRFADRVVLRSGPPPLGGGAAGVRQRPPMPGGGRSG